jgi:hypothetical protein
MYGVGNAAIYINKMMWFANINSSNEDRMACDS